MNGSGSEIIQPGTERGTVMRVQHWTTMDDAAKAQLFSRGTAAIFAPELKEAIGALIDDVAERGDAAVSDALAKFDHLEISPDRLRVSATEFEQARSLITSEVDNAIDTMIEGITRFNEQIMKRRGQDWWFESAPGLSAGEKVTPIHSVGLFCPSGKASYPSVMAQIGTPAKVAGVPLRVAITPPVPGDPSGRVDAATLVVAERLGITDVFRVNGPAGVAAVAFGTQSIPRVVKVLGPGSPAVTCAQIEVQRYGCATMMLLGPSESLILADDSADPVRLAADLLNEAEHGTDGASLLITPSNDLVAALQGELARQIAVLPHARREAAAASLGRNGGAIIVGSLEEGIDLANRYGPEHMQVATDRDQYVMEMMHTAGEILLGQHTTISAANYVLGCPASLPTSGFAAVSSGVTVEAFLKRTAVARADEAAMHAMAPAVIALADHEGFPAHANAQRIRVGGWPTPTL
jgi:histidinol dehydrogenase